MKPLTMHFCLFAEHLKKVVSRKLYAEVINAQQKAMQIFGVEIPFIVDTKHSINSVTYSPSRPETLAQHDWHYDVATLFYKRIEFLCKEYSVDLESMVSFCVCHEIGHAKEQRLFEEIGFFPNTFWMLPEGVPLKIESSDYNLRSHRVGDKEFFDFFSCAINDFSINKELAEHNMRNEIAKMVLFDRRGSRDVQISTKEHWHRYVLDCLLHLPLTIDVHEHGGLCEEEKKVLQEAQEKMVGDKWEKALSKLNHVDFFNPSSKRDITMELFEEVLGIPAFLSFPQNRETLFRKYKYSSIPKYWNKRAYQVMYL